MKPTMQLLKCVALTLLASSAQAHEGHGTPGSFGHDLQHQLWTFAAMVAIGALLLSGDRVLAVLRIIVRRRNRNDEDNHS